MKKQLATNFLVVTITLILFGAIVIHFLVKRAGEDVGKGLSKMAMQLAKDKKALDSMGINPLDTIRAAIDSFDKKYPSNQGK